MPDRTGRCRRIAAWLPVLVLAAAATTTATSAAAADPPAPAPIRVGAFPNLTHAQALVGRKLGWFDERVGAPIEWTTFPSGPSAMEALLTGALDLAYVGPNPAVNAYLRSKGGALRVVAGVTSGGAALVVRTASGIVKPKDLHGKRVASPQFGNTQDVALRHWLRSIGLVAADKGGDVTVLPVQNADTLTLFLRGELDAAWVPEPWVARLVKEGGGRVFVDERDLWAQGRFSTAVLVATTEFLGKRRESAARFVAAHVAITSWILEHPEEARRAANDQLATLTGKPLPVDVVAAAFARMETTADPLTSSCAVSANRAWELGYVPGKQRPDVRGLFDLSMLNEALRAAGRPEIALP